MNYRIRHVTKYQYSAPVPVCHNRIVLSPRPCERNQTVSASVRVRPRPTTMTLRVDSFGNTVHAFSIERSHTELEISTECLVGVVATPMENLLIGMAWEDVAKGVREQTDPNWLEVYPFLSDTQRVRRGALLADYARPSFEEGRPVPEAARDLTSRIHAEFAYDTKTTSVATSSDDVFRHKSGVCQDLAHISIAILRSLGLPARYVSGYLRTEPPPGRPRLIGADQSHAWFSVYGGPTVGWLDFDPTNNVAPTEDHITLAWGREYADVAPVRGVLVGGGSSVLSVSVDVMPTPAV